MNIHLPRAIKWVSTCPAGTKYLISDLQIFGQHDLLISSPASLPKVVSKQRLSAAGIHLFFKLPPKNILKHSFNFYQIANPASKSLPCSSTP